MVLRCGDWFDEAARLMDSAVEQYELFVALNAGEMIRVLPVNDGKQETVCILAESDLKAVVPKGVIPVLEYDLPEWIQAGCEAGSVIGEARMILEGKIIASSPLIVGETLAKRDYAYELDRLIRNWTSVPQSIAE